MFIKLCSQLCSNYTQPFCLCSSVCVWLVRIDGVPQQYAAEVADLALSVRSGGRFGYQPQQPHLHVSLTCTSCHLFMPWA